MQAYPSFQQPMPMQYPMYGQSAMQQQPYMDRLSQLQAMQQNLQAPMQQPFSGLNGRVVDCVEGIMASDVPMDGTFAIFPKRDLSEVYVKYWTGEGKIATISFKPISDSQGTLLPPDHQSLKLEELASVLGGIYEKVDTLSSKVDEVLKAKSPSRSRKEVNADE